MKTSSSLSGFVGAIGLAGALTLAGDAQAASKVITFKVPLSLQNVNPMVTAFTVDCTILGPDGGTLFFGRVDLPIKGTYAATLSVPVTVETAALKPKNPYRCRLWFNNQMPSATATVEWMKPKPGTPFTAEINGTLP